MSANIMNGFPSFGITAKPTTGDDGNNVIIGYFSDTDKTSYDKRAISINGSTNEYVIIDATIVTRDGDLVYCNGNDGVTKHILHKAETGADVIGEAFDVIRMTALCSAKANVSVNVVETTTGAHVSCDVSFDDTQDDLIGVEVLYFSSDDTSPKPRTAYCDYSQSVEIPLTNDMAEQELPKTMRAYVFVLYRNGTYIMKKYIGKGERSTR